MDFFYTHISDKAKQNVKEVLDSTFLSAGRIAIEFENQLNKQLGFINPVTVNSGTSALHLALSVAGVGIGDEVITSPQSFVATGLAILMQGARPVFADIQYETGNIDPKSIKEKITKKTKVILPIHWAGYPCDMDEIGEIAKEHNLLVIEDAAHAIGAKYKKKAIGEISDFTCFSFQAIKHLTTGDGGAICCLNKSHYEETKKKRWFGIDRENSKLTVLGEREFDIDQIGYKYHLNDLTAALGLGNLEDFSYIISRRKEIAKKYRQNLENIPGLKLLEYKSDRQSSNWLFTMLVEDRLGFVQKMNESNIPVSIVHQRIDRFSVFDGVTQGLVNQKKFSEKQIAIPLHSNLNNMEVENIIDIIKSGW
jgi:perosamine synthetase